MPDGTYEDGGAARRLAKLMRAIAMPRLPHLPLHFCGTYSALLYL